VPFFGKKQVIEAAPPAAATVNDVVARHPGPAFLVGHDGAVVCASPAAAPLMRDGDAAPAGAWWDDLFGWLASAEARSLPFRTSRIDTDRGLSLVEWEAVGLPDGTVLLLGRDVTVERNLRDALAESRQRLRDCVELACDFAWETGADGCFVYLSSGAVLGHAAERLVGRPAEDLLADPSLDRSPFEARQPVAGVEVALRRRDGKVVDVVVAARPLPAADGAWNGARGVCRRIEVAARGAA
jgi:PAS domain S-box-containing protein